VACTFLGSMLPLVGGVLAPRRAPAKEGEDSAVRGGPQRSSDTETSSEDTTSLVRRTRLVHSDGSMTPLAVDPEGGSIDVVWRVWW
jgi:hypothetical protein